MTLEQFINFLVGMLGYNPFASVSGQLIASGATVERFLQTMLGIVDSSMKPLVQQMIDWFS